LRARSAAMAASAPGTGAALRFTTSTCTGVKAA
jgi:hypothetical protein